MLSIKCAPVYGLSTFDLVVSSNELKMSRSLTSPKLQSVVSWDSLRWGHGLFELVDFNAVCRVSLCRSNAFLYIDTVVYVLPGGCLESCDSSANFKDGSTDPRSVAPETRTLRNFIGLVRKL